MSTCSTNQCGVGGWGGPQPGDPSNNSVLSAVSAFGGIDVSWTYPSTNPGAVAHTRLFRARTADFDTALAIAEVGGSFYYDRLDEAVEFFYWIQIVSINGTVGETIGPASAVAKPLIEKVIEDLTGKIDAGVLANALKAKIERIDLLERDFNLEVLAREDGETTLAEAIAAAQAGVGEALTFLLQEQYSRVSGDSALATSIEQVAVTSENALAIAKDSLTAEIVDLNGRVTATSTAMTQLEVQVGEDIAFAVSRLESQISSIGGDTTALSTRIDQVAVEAADQLAAAQSSLSSSISSIGNTVANLSTALTNVESEFADELAQTEVALSTRINTVDGKVTGIGALYTAKVSVNGLIGGFGVYNDGTEVEAGFDVDTFWIGRTAANKRKPFIISGGVVYIDEAAIQKLTFNKLRDESGSFVVSDGKVKAEYLAAQEISIEAMSSAMSGGATSGGRIRMTPNRIDVFDGSNTLRVRLGAL